MGKTLIVAVGLAYAYIAIEALFRKNYPTAIIFGGYAASNVGLWLLAD
ncbi:hypothetical protein V1290_000073 [Bradyrhizobium sp. AZCC 1578]